MSNSCGCNSNVNSCAPPNPGVSPANIQEAESMMFEGGSDIFTSNRHALHNNEAKSFNMMTFRTQDDAPFFTPRPQAAYVSATVPSGREECHRVTSLMLRSNFQWVKHAAALTVAGAAVAGGINYVKTGKVIPDIILTEGLRRVEVLTPAPAAQVSKTTNIIVLNSIL